jgi:hypothetical protein
MERKRFKSLQTEFHAIADEFSHTDDFDYKRTLIEKAKAVIGEASELILACRQRAESNMRRDSV